MAIPITTVARVKALANSKQGSSISSNADAQIEVLIDACSAVFERYLNRWIATEERTETFTLEGHQTLVRLKAWPVDSIASVYNDSAREYPANSEIDASAYYLETETGNLQFEYELAPGLGALRVTYTGGMAPDGTDPTANFIALYPDIAYAADLQVFYAWQRSINPGSSAASAGGGSATYTGQFDLLDSVKTILRPHRRFGL